ncbi:hypothetical protein [Achromobacter ruhlandii]|uniref:hypothetical protein n=1 Tax=Achromobacter ruhlandii TaxID=72557 RepID=UPI0006BF0FFC|nr:hypothetical protein [Achromobacter ruhlandii]CUJ30096.1 Uncharacterised protein [Achromobacter ruhlandii]CUK16062.1 Uncharacterised protein [Achromobacter ruhlandii]
MLNIKERPGSITVAEMRKYFEQGVNNTLALKENTPLGIMEINGEFAYYLDSDTDTMWLGFALGMRAAERVARAAPASAAVASGGDAHGRWRHTKGDPQERHLAQGRGLVVGETQRPYCYALESRDREGVLVDIEYNRVDSFSGGRTGGKALYDHAAPQASAKDGMTSSPDLATLVSFIFDRFGRPGDAGELPTNVAAAVRRLEARMRPQADKDSEHGGAETGLRGGARQGHKSTETRGSSGLDGGAHLADTVVLPPLPAELRDTETESRAYARAAVLNDRQQHAKEVEAAWAECRAEVGAAGWTVSESINYHGFFLHGWRAALSATRPEQGERDAG